MSRPRICMGDLMPFLKNPMLMSRSIVVSEIDDDIFHVTLPSAKLAKSLGCLLGSTVDADISMGPNRNTQSNDLPKLEFNTVPSRSSGDSISERSYSASSGRSSSASRKQAVHRRDAVPERRPSPALSWRTDASDSFSANTTPPIKPEEYAVRLKCAYRTPAESKATTSAETSGGQSRRTARASRCGPNPSDAAEPILVTRGPACQTLRVCTTEQYSCPARRSSAKAAAGIKSPASVGTRRLGLASARRHNPGYWIDKPAAHAALPRPFSRH
ncbi:hypothetical protein BDY17DRAFT_177719 [Neohortaea acidophila]|uniref:Uncharacterized protein n=1 Tax=Neohortaea acidophila TaxID=245834 RepID=A0A6A6PQ23_9PEZI|nr:uncharacterized protein BDY17DRAFT_177719 [Neohortaea acidophila]KAF2482122.1 hypothetical protein BDY17DRAFT_177719 [Neohortaea acidophila]